MGTKKLMTLVMVFLCAVFSIAPIGTAQFEVDASEAFQAVNSSTAIVTAPNVNLRTGPAKTFDIICKLKKDQKVTVMAKLGNWYAVYVDSSGTVGVISSYYLSIDKEKTTVVSKQLDTPKKKTSVTNKVNTKAATTSSKHIADITTDEKALLELVNKTRKDEGLNALEMDEGLVKIARLKANDMRTNNYFSHTSKYYGTPFDMMKKYNIKFSAAGENIAGNQTLEKVVKAWANESGNNLLNKKFTHTGIGIVESPVYGKLFVQMFIKK